MNSNRRADLQRKLSLKAVPRPPEGLADRIKADIPKYLDAEAERGRFSRAVAFNMRIAASILLLVTSLVVTVYLVQGPEQEKASLSTPGPFAPARRALPQQTASTATTEEVRLDMRDEAPLQVPRMVMASPPPAARRMRANDAPPAQPVETGVEGGIAGGVVGGAVGAPSDVAVAAEAPVTVAERPAAPEPVPAPAAPMRAEAASASAPSLGLVAEAQAAKTTLGPKDEVFGISVDPQNFQRIRETIESGGRPAASEVNVDALVNYFAGPPAKRPKRGVHLDVEASPAAVAAEGEHAILRFTIDTPAVNRAQGSAPPVASDARVEVVFNNEVVANASRVGGGEPLARESVLLHGTSVTGLYALELKSHHELSPMQAVATVRLHYTDVTNGKKQTITRYVRGRDLAKSWQSSSRRHRLASLGAVWGETLKGTATGFDVARRAEELATQDPKDALAKELAAAANATADGGR